MSKLSPAQREEFRNVYELIDADGDGSISVVELKRALDSVGTERSDEELLVVGLGAARCLVTGG